MVMTAADLYWAHMEAQGNRDIARIYEILSPELRTKYQEGAVQATEQGWTRQTAVEVLEGRRKTVVDAPKPETPDVPVTWDDLGRLAEALFVLTQANLSEEVLGEISAMLIRRIGRFGEELLAEAGQPAQEQTQVVMEENFQSAQKRVRDIQQVVEAQARGEAQTPWESGGGTIVAWAKLTAPMRMQMTRRVLVEVGSHLQALETMVPAEIQQLVALRERVGDIQLELQTMALRKAFREESV